ncbi:MAG: hypothetical protein ACYTEZ_05715 [Planctomycetota bacterium]
MLPGWQRTLEPHLRSGALVAVGVVQEQHVDRIRLYRQWRRLAWPVLVDQLNLLDHRVVPIPMGIDENGVVTHPRLSPEDLPAFLSRVVEPSEMPEAPLPHRLAGDGHFLAGKLDAAIEAYRSEQGPRALFRLGVALRRRYESDGRRPGDGQAAVDAWTRALAARPDNYIWRRRIQQYGPRLDKPYNMFGWVEQARAEIRARGEEPVPLRVEPRGTELIGRGPVPTVQAIDPDPERKVPIDPGLVEVESIVAPSPVRPGHRARVRVVFRIRDGWWNNESDPLTLHVEPAEPLTLMEGLLSHPNAGEPETKETRILEFEVEVAAGAPAGTHGVRAHALFNVCEDRGGVCRYLRRDFHVKVTVSPEAPKIQ